jgi:quercetin dioxygenase-like cupin family protein
MAEAVFHGPDDGQATGNPVGGEVVFMVRGPQSGGHITAFETSVSPGGGPPLHVHANEEETLYVLEGEFRFQLGEQQVTAQAGSLVFVPRGTPHTFQNTGDERGRMLIHFSPSGMEKFFERFAELAEPGPDEFVRLGKEVGMTVVGPPLAES